MSKQLPRLGSNQQQQPSRQPPPPIPRRSPPGGLPTPAGTRSNANAPAQRPPAPPGGLGARLGSRATWEIIGLADVVTYFDLNSIAPAVGSLLGLGTGTTAEHIIAALENDKAKADALKEQLDSAWQAFNFTGAMLVYDWQTESKNALNARLEALKAPSKYVQADEPLLVLNVLARARSSLLMVQSPLALEKPFLNRLLIADDPRLETLVRQQPHQEIPFYEPQELELEDEDESP
ncbi:MAG: hypothetical protein GYB67_15935 [Chloroflexi bacterium]|nr:hypothetical protein [Chloroflexota bacterium]